MPNLISALLSQVQDRAARATVTEICIGVHWTLVLLDLDGELRGGLASTLSGGDDDHHHSGRPPVQEAGRLLDRNVYDLATMATHSSILEASVGMATLNALIDADLSRCIEVNAADVIAERGANRKIAVVGHFPFVPELHDIAETLWVLELNPRAGDLPSTEAPHVLPQADVVALTGTSLLNKTFDDLIALCRPDAFVVVLGATTPITPLLFEVGVDALSGTVIVDPYKARQAVTQGATFRQISGKRLLTMFRPGA